MQSLDPGDSYIFFPRRLLPDAFERPIYVGDELVTVQSADATKVITVRTNGFDPAASEGGSAFVIQVGAVADNGKSSSKCDPPVSLQPGRSH